MDTSAFIRLDRDYSREVFPSLWDDFIITLVNESRLIATEEVKEELKRKDDDLFKWVKNHCSGMFIKTETKILTRVNEIMGRFPNLVDPNNPTHNQADPFVIALALETQNILPGIEQDTEIMVITYEKSIPGTLMAPKCRIFADIII